MHLVFQLFLLEQSSVGFILFPSRYLHWCVLLDLYMLVLCFWNVDGNLVGYSRASCILRVAMGIKFPVFNIPILDLLGFRMRSKP